MFGHNSKHKTKPLIGVEKRYMAKRLLVRCVLNAMRPGTNKTKPRRMFFLPKLKRKDQTNAKANILVCVRAQCATIH